MRWLLYISLLIGIVYLAVDFHRYISAITKTSVALPHPADVAVVLTGGKGRVDMGVTLLLMGKAKHLYISGVDDSVKRVELLETFQSLKQFDSCCLTLGYEAKSTAGNASEISRWLTRKGYTHVLVVTANYHMPRSMLLLGQELPNVHFYPWPIVADDLDTDAWWQAPYSRNVLLTEYGKYLISRWW
jgi:uncharacterized SAM-binding protein YcdF (DUF218 family)